MIKFSRPLIGAAVVLLLNLSAANVATAQDTRSDLQSWLQSDSKNWLSDYVWNSIRNIRVIERSSESIVFSARYDYRLGDSTFSDTAYFGFTNGKLYCLAYAFSSEYCSLYGKEKR